MCCVQSVKTAVALSQSGRHALCTPSAARPAMKLGRLKQKSGFSVNTFGSPTAQIPIESCSPASERFRIDLK